MWVMASHSATVLAGSANNTLTSAQRLRVRANATSTDFQQSRSLLLLAEGSCFLGLALTTLRFLIFSSVDVLFG